MLIDFNKEKLSKTLADFSDATGININLTDENFNMLNISYNTHNRYCAYIQNKEDGLKRCLRSDMDLLIECRQTKKPQFHVCHAGLVDIGVPIMHEDAILGYLILGQMKKNKVFSRNMKIIEELSLDEAKMKEYYDGLVTYDEKKTASIINIAVILAKYIFFEKMLYPVTNKCIEKATSYINANLSDSLNIQKISTGIGYSSSELYKSFHMYHHCTVGEYITKMRVEYSSVLLLETDLSVEEVSQKVGFSNAPYFSKKFKELKGISPLKFKKNARQG